ncbi:MAG: hypothetical protein ACOWYE_01560, partial [Desulfatiglandales bacterium]
SGPPQRSLNSSDLILTNKRVGEIRPGEDPGVFVKAKKSERKGLFHIHYSNSEKHNGNPHAAKVEDPADQVLVWIG